MVKIGCEYTQETSLATPLSEISLVGLGNIINSGGWCGAGGHVIRKVNNVYYEVSVGGRSLSGREVSQGLV